MSDGRDYSMTWLLAVLLAVAVAVAVGGCGSSSEDEDVSSTDDGGATETTDSPAAPATAVDTSYEDVETMRQVFEGAGHQCPGWTVRATPSFGNAAADCTDYIVFILYDDAAAALEHVEGVAETINEALGVDVTYVLGTNWSASCDDAGAQLTCAELADVLGGTTVAFEAG